MEWSKLCIRYRRSKKWSLLAKGVELQGLSINLESPREREAAALV